MIGIIAAIAIPSLLRARVAANEAATIGDIRTLVAAQAGYAEANRGFFESQDECLVAPARCIPGYSGPSVLNVEWTHSPRPGYAFAFHAGQRFASGTAPPNMSPASTNGYALIAYPIVAGQTGMRALCADSSGTVCTATGVGPEGLAEVLEAAPGIRCSSVCTPLQ